MFNLYKHASTLYSDARFSVNFPVFSPILTWYLEPDRGITDIGHRLLLIAHFPVKNFPVAYPVTIFLRCVFRPPPSAHHSFFGKELSSLLSYHRLLLASDFPVKNFLVTILPLSFLACFTVTFLCLRCSSPTMSQMH